LQLDKLLGRDPEPEAAVLPPSAVPRGLYLYGDVGTGKSMLMDLFYDTLPPHIRRKRRAHFHAFMIDVHKRVHAVKAAAGRAGLVDPIMPVARDLANAANVLCFDEFQVRRGGLSDELCVIDVGAAGGAAGDGYRRCDDIAAVV
jgi:peroxisome-assembly ATPase